MGKKKRRATAADRCPKCRINTHWCFCSHIKEIECPIKVSIVMHYTERWLTSNTAYFASLVLPSCEIIERGNMDQPIPKAPFSEENVDYLYLFPTEDSLPVTEFKASSKPIHLVVPDGSWSKAKKIHKREDLFREMPKYHLTDVGESNYKLRKSPGENYLCTYEAIAHALSQLGQEQVKSDMLEFFDVFVQRVLMSRSGDFNMQGQV
jgi:DTW domain-containing protein YfiP